MGLWEVQTTSCFITGLVLKLSSAAKYSCVLYNESRLMELRHHAIYVQHQQKCGRSQHLFLQQKKKHTGFIIAPWRAANVEVSLDQLTCYSLTDCHMWSADKGRFQRTRQLQVLHQHTQYKCCSNEELLVTNLDAQIHRAIKHLEQKSDFLSSTCVKYCTFSEY